MIRKSQIPILLATFLSFLLSVGLWFLGSKEAGQFVGLWVPSILCVGIYLQVLAERATREGGDHA